MNSRNIIIAIMHIFFLLILKFIFINVFHFILVNEQITIIIIGLITLNSMRKSIKLFDKVENENKAVKEVLKNNDGEITDKVIDELTEVALEAYLEKFVDKKKEKLYFSEFSKIKDIKILDFNDNELRGIYNINGIENTFIVTQFVVGEEMGVFIDENNQYVALMLTIDQLKKYLREGIEDGLKEIR